MPFLILMFVLVFTSAAQADHRPYHRGRGHAHAYGRGKAPATVPELETNHAPSVLALILAAGYVIRRRRQNSAD